MTITINLDPDPTDYIVSITPYNDPLSPTEVILQTPSYKDAHYTLLQEAPFNYQVTIHDCYDTLLLQYVDSTPVYVHNPITEGDHLNAQT